MHGGNAMLEEGERAVVSTASVAMVMEPSGATAALLHESRAMIA